MERKGPPTFHVLVEIQNQDQLAVYHDVAKTVDTTLRKDFLQPEIRIRTEDGEVEIQQKTISKDFSLDQQEPSSISTNHAEMQKQPPSKSLRIFTYGVNRDRLEKAIKKFQAPAYIVKDLDSADVILSHKSQRKIRSRRLRTIQSQGIPFHLIRSNTIPQMEHFLHSLFYLGERSQEDEALQVTEVAISEVFEKGHSIELTPTNSYIRSLQHQLAERYGLSTKSKGKEPNRRVIIYPT